MGPQPKQQRARETRHRVLRATADTLAESGLAGTSTGQIAKRAGVSQGALFRHFPSKQLLLTEATSVTFGELRSDFVERFRLAASNAADPMSAALSTLWDVYTDPRVLAVYELYLAARTDPALADALRPVLAVHMDAIVAIAAGMFPKAADSPDFNDAVSALLSTLQGTALMAVVMTPERRDGHRELRFMKEIAVATLGQPLIPELE